MFSLETGFFGSGCCQELKFKFCLFNLKAFCDIEPIYTYEGTYDINVLVTGREITGVSAIKSASGPLAGKKTRARL